jgi:outer membrane receptor protein involved in Fe transport
MVTPASGEEFVGHLQSVLARATLLAATAASAHAQSSAQREAHELAPVTVTGTRERELLSETPASVGLIGDRAIRDTAPTHPQQILSQVPGVAVAVTNGEGHTTAIRQPFTTSPLYLFLEDGLPIRATGFFNHNALYELNIPMAGGIEVVRGPGSALYGSDAIGGVVNILTRTPVAGAGVGINGEVGRFGWRRAMLDGDTGATAAGSAHADLNLTHTDGWRDKTAYDRQSGTVRLDSEFGATHLKTIVSAARIDQETGANSPLVYADYINHPTRNNFPIAYRKVGALRLSSEIERSFGEGSLAVTPYARANSMDLLASFLLSSDPTISYSSNRSYGVLGKWRQDFPSSMRARLIVGLDVDVSPGERREDRLNVTVTGAGASRVFSAHSVAGRIYDYAVTFTQVSPYLHGEVSATEDLRFTMGARYDRLGYKLDNRVAAPFTQAGGANFYGQVANTDVGFERLSPKIGATYALGAQTSLYAAYNTGFRVPSESQLFRPSVSANSTDAVNKAQLALGLKPIKATQVELGLRSRGARWHYDVVVFDLVKRDDLVSQRDLATNVTTNVNAGKTQHRGIELGWGVELMRELRLDAAWSYARHKYVDWVTTAANFSGKEIESAPRQLGNTRLSWTPRESLMAQLEWIRIGSYWLEASNSEAFPRYPGHDLVNLRTSWQVERVWSIFVRVYNVADKRFAESAQVASNTPVYSPGLPRTWYGGVEARW